MSGADKSTEVEALPPAAQAVARTVATLIVRRLRQRPESVRTRTLKLKLDKDSVPALFAGTPEDGKRAWLGIDALIRSGLVLVHFDRKRPAHLQPLYRNPSLEVVPGALEALASIAGIELAAPIGQQLAAHLREDPHFGRPEVQAALLLAPADLATLPFDDVVARLRNLVELAATPGDGFLREASARVFDGLSKVLDGRADFVAGLVGSACPWRETPIPLMVAAPNGSLVEVVFVENLTTFERLRLARERFPGTAFIYSGGWRGAATRAGAEPGRSLFYDRPLNPEDERSLQATLDGREARLPVYFFGDLDFSGMGILATMRRTYPGLTAWEPGYAPLLEQLNAGRGHHPSSAEKERQANPGATGCPYADMQLLPRLVEAGRFVDQEVWF